VIAMKWLRFIFMISAASWFLFALNEFRKEIDNYNLGNASDYQYEKSPPELKKIINTHLIFHEKIKTTFHDLIKDVKPLLNNEDAEKIEERLKAIQKEREEQILTARKEAEVLISQAKDLAEKQKQDTVQKTGDEVAKTVALAKTQIAGEKEKMLVEIKTEVVELIVQASGKILEQVTDKKIDKAIIQNTLKNIDKKSSK